MKLATELLTAALLLCAAMACTVSVADQQHPTETKFQAGPWNKVFRVEDPDLRVVCWVSDGNRSGGITCLPSHDIEPRLSGGDDE